MDQISQQLKEEIDSLREYIQHTEERLLVSNWVGEMLTPFEDTEQQFSQEELAQIVGALYKARHQFSVNGHLGNRLDTIIDRYSHLFTDSADNDDDRIPAKDPQNDNVLDFVEDEEDEDNEVDSTQTLFEPFRTGPVDATAQPAVRRDSSQQPAPIAQPSKDVGKQVAKYGKNKDFQIVEDKRDNALLDLFTAKRERNGDLSEPTTTKQPTNDQPLNPLPDGAADDLFAQENAQKPTKPTRAAKSKTQGRSQRDRRKASPERASKIRQQAVQEDQRPDESFDIFSERIAVDDLLLNMDIRLPEQDIVQLARSLKNKLSSSTVVALQKNPQAEAQYVLIPRISRFIFAGNIYPCTVKNLARTYIAFFGDIKDLMQYKGMPFLNHETPELGWALITKEAARETYDKNFMEQNQYLRYMAAETGIPSHLVRRRTLIETIYDMIVGRMVLKTTFLKRTLDWTSDGPNKSEFICAYFSERGIRLRHLPRTQHNRALGLCPNW